MNNQKSFLIFGAILALIITLIPSPNIQRYLGSIPYIISISLLCLLTIFNIKEKNKYTEYYLPIILMGFMITAIIQIARNLYAESAYFYVNQLLFLIPLIAFYMMFSPSINVLEGGQVPNTSTNKWVWLIIAGVAIGTQMILLHIIDLTRNFFETDDGEKKIKDMEVKLGINQ